MKLAASVLLGVLALGACAKEDPAAITRERVTTTYADAQLPTRTARASMLVEPSPVVVAPKPLGECEVGTRRSCLPPSREPAADPFHGRGPFKYCVLGADGVGHYSLASCNTPLAVSFDGAPVTFTRVATDFHVGAAERTEWLSPRTPWLALDRDGNGCVDSERELFAGFGALAELDANGDGVLDASDPAFGELVLWSDADQDKRCTLAEISGLDLPRIPLAASPAVPKMGSYEGESVTVGQARIVDVYLAADVSR